MQVSIDVTDEMRREAEARGLPVVDYIELLMEKGRETLDGSAALSTAIERIRPCGASKALPGAKGIKPTSGGRSSLPTGRLVGLQSLYAYLNGPRLQVNRRRTFKPSGYTNSSCPEGRQICPGDAKRRDLGQRPSFQRCALGGCGRWDRDCGGWHCSFC